MRSMKPSPGTTNAEHSVSCYIVCAASWIMPRRSLATDMGLCNWSGIRISYLDRLTDDGRWQSKIAYLRTIHPSSFEEMLLTALERAGYRIKRNKRYTGDGGLDGQFWLPNGQKMLIQAKRYQASVSSQHIDDFGRLCESMGVAGLFIHTGKTPKASWDSLAGKPIVIISGPRLIQFLIDPAATLRGMKVG